MRWLALFAACLACKGKQAPPPRHDDARVVAKDAAPADAAIDAAPDAAAASTTITPDGVGPITAKVKDEEQFAKLLPGFTVTSEHRQGDEYNFDEIVASKGATQVLRAVVQDGALFKVEVEDPTFATQSGIAVGMTVADLVAKLPDAKCVYEKYDAADDAERVDQALRCQAASLPQVLFDIDYGKLTVPEGGVSTKTIGKRKIVQITWLAAKP